MTSLALIPIVNSQSVVSTREGCEQNVLLQ